MTTQKRIQTPPDPEALTHADFRWFLMYFPDVVLKARKVQRLSLTSVGMMLAQFGNYETGTGIRVSQTALADITGASRNTVKKVLDVLKEAGAIEVVDHQRRGGKPSENYRLRKSSFVAKVLDIKNRHHQRDEAVNGPQMSIQDDEWSSDEHSLSPGEHSLSPGEHNKNSQNEKNCSVADAPSPAPSSLSLTARDGAVGDVWEGFDFEALGLEVVG